MEPVRVADAMSPEWFAARSHSIGASEISAAAGLSPYQTPLELYSRKRGERPPISDNDAMRMGRLLEPVVKSEFLRVTGLSFSDPNPPMYRHGEYDVITATPDGVINETELLEAKTASWRMKSSWGEQDSDDVPVHYLCQCQQQMAVMNASVVHLAVLFDGFELKMFKILRNDVLIRLLIDAGLELWRRIQDGHPPEPTWEHPSTPRLIREIHQSIDDARIELNEAEVEAWGRYEALGAFIKDADEERDLIKAKILHEIGDNFAGLLPDGRMIRRKVIEKKSYVVAPQKYIEVRVCKADSGRIIERTESQTEVIEV
jgi:putative phage-type endonuclease